ncbi:hypothetical protein F900_01889 [Acinetobacter modestus]|uniref:HK97 gp10 family phage protein n=1 Tax=Acinetobacter modestus TaxID=1776740 RepID=N9NFW9_9GAMM|nr:hypothetical protein [Acinetobacter modestus]ENX00905.1 hypothetical protein F900_01889 [Acinetobacter modestus]
MLGISIASDVRNQIRQVSNEYKKQVAFALVKTVNELAQIALVEEKKGLASFFDNPTPFTVNSVAIKYAKKGNPTATVYVRPLAARYIAPYEYGGKQFLGAKPADLVPISVAANQYGNLPRNTIKKYLNRKDVFLGKVGSIYGLWQRPTVQTGKRKGGKTANTTGKLKLLVSFHDPVNTQKRLNFGSRANAVVTRNIKSVFERQLAAAIASAR